MSDPVSLAASITGLVTISCKIAQVAKKVYDSGKDARTSILRIKEEMDTLHLIFCQVQVLVQKRPRKSRLTLISVHHLLTILTGCMLYFSSLDEKLSAVAALAPGANAFNSSPARKIVARAEWSVWTEAEIAVIIENLERQKSSLVLMLTIINWCVHIFT